MIYFLYLGLLFSFLLFTVYKYSGWRALPTKTALDIGLILMAFGLFGARLTHVLWESPAYYWERPLEALAIWEGGFVFYGGALLATLAGWIYVRLQKQSFLVWADFYAPIAALGYGLGRFSCFISNCCFGQVCDYPWAIEGRHPTQLYAMVWELLVFCFLVYLAPKIRKPTGLLFCVWLLFHAVGRLVMEHFRADFRGPFVAGLSFSSAISVVLFAVAITGAVHILRKSSRISS